ncbi:unnamed protein product [Triticum turgidum subsp. durum]|uniref:F-box domain-containing protein n=1 Tax=Triticum turgidum subsp. durum TaxID=4567 RepID=A0A9R1P603_TRITD|nr:unnamed protein product [Triticum turgidum subsp. durum]
MRRVRVSSHHSPVQKLGDSDMKLTPRFRLAGTTSPSSTEPEQQPPWEMPLIPGLPDDAALNCLLRLPVEAHGACRLVCRRWRHLLADKARFFTHRKAMGLRSPWLFTLAFHRCTGKIQWKVLDLDSLAWHAIPGMPCRDRACPRGFGCVAGGYSTDQFELDSAEVLDPVNGVWQPIASMGANMASSDSAVVGGRLYVTEGCAWPFFSSPRGQVYDPKADRWEAMPAGMREGWTGLSVVIDGRLFVISEYERMKVKVYDPETDSWDPVDGPPMPERIMKPLSVSCLESKIVVVGRGLHVVIGHVKKQSSCDYLVRWQDVEVPRAFSDLTPSSSQILHA